MMLSCPLKPGGISRSVFPSYTFREEKKWTKNIVTIMMLLIIMLLVQLLDGMQLDRFRLKSIADENVFLLNRVPFH